MVNASKILTVSYGTFSCTLEGFDDPFSTMRSIAEYFRDLAADDRYFGAEPPTPDAEMLHRIAEREINRRVEAKVKKNGVVLRQIEDDRADITDSRDKAEPLQTAPKAFSSMAPRHADATGTVATRYDTDDVDAKKMDAATVESVAEKLRRIRAAVARSHVEPQFTGTFGEDEHASELYRARSIDAAFADAEETEAAPVAFEVEDAVEAEASATVVEQDDVTVSLDDPMPEPEAAEEEIQADTAEEAIAEEIAPQDTVESAQDAEPAVEAAEVAQAEPDENDDADVLISALMGDDAADEDTSAFEAEADDVDLSAIDFEDDESIFAKADESAEKPDVLVLDKAELVPDTLVEDAGILDIEDLTAKLSADSQSGDDDLAEIDEQMTPDESLQDDEPDTDQAPTETPAAPVARARVVKMTRTEFLERYVEVSETDDVEINADDDVAETAEDGAPDAIRAALGDTGLSPEDEDDLINELLAAEQDDDTPESVTPQEHTGAEAEFEDIDAEEDDDGQDQSTGRFGPSVEEIAQTLAAAVAPTSEDSDDLSVDRLLRQADSELKDNDSSRRRSAIAHLKAAVASVRADGGRSKLDAEAEEAKTLNQFRSDLAKVVRPEANAAEADDVSVPVTPKPVATAPTKHVSTDAPRPRRKMPPLMLVSEQRIDKPVNANPDAAPIRPRRVQSEDLAEPESSELFEEADAERGPEDAAGNIFGEPDNFAGFVADTGAEGVQDLLEASLAFGTVAQGQSFNSRPQIMQRVLRFMPEGTLTREEGLRAFGVLLREGRIVRIQRGQFVLPDNSRFKTERKSAAG